MDEQQALQPISAQPGGLAVMPAFETDLAELKTFIADGVASGTFTEFSLPHIKIPGGGGGAFAVQNADGEDYQQKLRVIVLGDKLVRRYWKNGYEETGGGTPPDCHSIDGVNGIGDPGGLCEGCPLNQWGSAAKGKGKGCKEMYQLFILRDGYEGIFPEVLNIPPSSKKAYENVKNNLANYRKRVGGVVLEVGLTPAKSSTGLNYSQATFRQARNLTQGELAKITQYRDAVNPLIVKPITITVNHAEGDSAF